MNPLDRLYSPPTIGAPGRRRAREGRRDLLRAGLFALAMLGLVLLAFYWALPGLFGGAYRLDAYFDSAEGLDVGLRVEQDGYPIGFVERVMPLFPGRDAGARHCLGEAATVGQAGVPRPCFRAVLRIQNDWPLATDSVAQLAGAGLLKGDVVRIVPGRASQRLAAGARIATRSRPADLLDQFGALSAQLQRIVAETVEPALASVREQIQALEGVIGGPADGAGNRRRLADTLDHLMTFSAHLEASVDPQAVAEILDSVRTLARNLEQISGELRAGSGEIQREVRHAVSGYGNLAVSANQLLDSNRPALTEALDDAQYLLQELATALTPILQNLEDTTRNLSALSRELRQDPKSLLKGHDKEERSPWFK